MQRKETMQKVGVVLLFLGTGALGTMVGLYLFMTNPDLLPLPEPEPTATPVPAAQPTQAPDWKVTFEYRFTSSGWPPGSHQYRLQVNCPDTGSGTWTGRFTVSESASLRTGRVFLRIHGPMDASTGGASVGAIHPDQSVGAAVTLSYPTLDQAETARAECTAQVRIGNGPPQRMDSRIPTQGDG